MLMALMIYTLWRQPNHFLSYTFEQIGLSHAVLIAQEGLGTYDAPDWMRYNLPDMLWMLSLVLMIMIIWDFQVSRQSLSWMGMSLIMALVYECLQITAWVPGVFDLLDLLFILLGALPVLLLFIKPNHRHETSRDI